jgi:hypothetical protein
VSESSSIPTMAPTACKHCRFCLPYSYIMGKSWRTDNHCTRQVVSFPEPCEMFEREPGADDE